MRVPKFLHWLLVTVAGLPTLVDMAILLRLRTEDQETQQRREAILNIPKSQKEIDKYATSVHNIYIYILISGKICTTPWHLDISMYGRIQICFSTVLI